MSIISFEYTANLQHHRLNVQKGYFWLQKHLPNIAEHINYNKLQRHDESKFYDEESEAYDAYFFGGDCSAKVVNNFNYARLHHIHANPHHWQHWVLFEDDPSSGVPYKILEMPEDDAIEMILDWWSFSWAADDLMWIFAWYEKRKNIMQLHPKTRIFVEKVLKQIHEKLKEEPHGQAERG